MTRKSTGASFIAIIVVALAALTHSDAWANDVPQMGSQPSYDSLIKSLTPDPSQVGAGNSRGLRVLSGKAPAPAPVSGTSEHSSAAPAVALDVRFASGSDQLTDAARDTVGRIGAALKSSQLSGYKFLVEGHTDNVGNPEANQVLSERRAEAVKTYLVSNAGIPADRLQTAGKGSSEPLDALHPENGVNRRVQIVNLGQ